MPLGLQGRGLLDQQHGFLGQPFVRKLDERLDQLFIHERVGRRRRRREHREQLVDGRRRRHGGARRSRAGRSREVTKHADATDADFENLAWAEVLANTPRKAASSLGHAQLRDPDRSRDALTAAVAWVAAHLGAEGDQHRSGARLGTPGPRARRSRGGG